MARLVAGTRASVRVPATSANLGPGFDAMGLALDWYDSSTVEVLDQGFEFELTGEGSEKVPRDVQHLVISTILTGLENLGADAGGLRLVAHNTIPHSRGLGSSAAAIVGGLALAWGLARPGVELDREWLCQLSSRAEGHPDNACAAAVGGAVLAWHEDSRYGLVRLELDPRITAIAFVPTFEVATSGARGVLPEMVSRRDAVEQATRSAMLVHALTRDPGLLLAATVDRLHQEQRACLMRPSAQLVQRLRAASVPAVISGAGPTVLALGVEEQLREAAALAGQGFAVHPLRPGVGVELTSGG